MSHTALFTIFRPSLHFNLELPLLLPLLNPDAPFSLNPDTPQPRHPFRFPMSKNCAFLVSQCNVSGTLNNDMQILPPLVRWLPLLCWLGFPCHAPCCAPLPCPADVSLCPAAADAGPPMVVELQPGDVLYVPPFWWHHVLSITSSMSLTTYSRARGIAEHMHAIYSHEHQFGAAQGGLCKGCVPVLCLCAMCYVLRPACCVLCLCM